VDNALVDQEAGIFDADESFRACIASFGDRDFSPLCAASGPSIANEWQAKKITLQQWDGISGSGIDPEKGHLASSSSFVAGKRAHVYGAESPQTWEPTSALTYVGPHIHQHRQ
jgi:hypothetical protein